MVDTVSDRIILKGATRGFDYLRLFLALGVLAWHSIYVSGNAAVIHAVLTSWCGPIKALLLPMFFSLSGFLVAGSIERARTLEGFATLRALRIVPALAVEVLLSALILGAALTTLPLHSYFASPILRLYFLNMVGDIHFLLPGVFTHNPVRNTVNLSLWTVPYELQCYAALMFLAACGLFRKRGQFALVTMIFYIGLWAGFLILRPHGPASAETMTMPGGGW
jgi:peptidoglycan/LPS O-acetylase OafA/YrhL